MRYVIFALMCLVASCSAGGAAPQISHHSGAVGYSERAVGIVQAYGGNVFFEQRDGPGAPIPHLGKDGWVQYACTADANFRNDNLQIIPRSPQGSEFPGEYWVGLHNRDKRRWQWFGPVTSFGANAMPVVGHDSYKTIDFDWDLVSNGNTVVVYCTKPFAMDYINFGFIPSNMPF